MKPARPKFLTDENVSSRLVAFLRKRGHDTFLLGMAWKDQRFIISHDRDFGKVAIDQHEPCYGVLYLRLKDQRAPNAIAVMERFLDRRIEIQPGSLIVIQESRARIRRLPHR